MRRPARLAAGVLIAGLVLTGCGSPKTAPGAKAVVPAAAKIDQSSVVAAGPVGQNLPASPTVDRIRKRGRMVFAGARSTLGFSLLDPATGKLTGFDAGMAQLLAKYLTGKADAEISPSSSDTREALLQNHTVDVAIETYTINADRAKLVNFAGPYYMASGGIAVRKSDNSVAQPADLGGKQVATEAGAAQQALIAAVPTAKPVLLATTAACLTALSQGRVQAVTLNNASLLGAVAQHPDLKLLDVTIGSNPFGIGLPKDDPAFKTIVNGFLKQIESDGTWTKLWESTVGQLMTGKPAPQPPAIGSVPGS
jgi:glutamate transport system substrate-binding protein